MTPRLRVSDSRDNDKEFSQFAIILRRPTTFSYDQLLLNSLRLLPKGGAGGYTSPYVKITTLSGKNILCVVLHSNFSPHNFHLVQLYYADHEFVAFLVLNAINMSNEILEILDYFLRVVKLVDVMSLVRKIMPKILALYNDAI